MAAVAAVLMVVLATVIGAFANDPDMLQDVCVADKGTGINVNGFPCKAINMITPEDFFFNGIAKPGKIPNNPLRSVVKVANIANITGLNTLGISMARVDFGPYGLNPPHIHPRATEMIFVLEGELYVGFITTANQLISKVVKTGENFVFPRGLTHFQKNLSKFPASVLAAFNSQNAGTQQLVAALFTSKPPLPNDVLAQAFNIDVKLVQKISAGLA